MLNRKYYPFERNSYYFGKLLTAKDFEAEQKYVNDKRRFVNRLNGANGILSGLGVIRADDASIILQAGCALDGTGREIVVPETKVIKLSTITGFRELSTATAYLGIRYQEKPADKVYAVMADDEDGGERYNKIREGYELTLLDAALANPVQRPLDAFVTRQVIYADNDVELAQYAPKFLPRVGSIQVRVELKKLSPGSLECSFTYDMEVPNFDTADKAKTLTVDVENIRMTGGEVRTWVYTLTPQPHIWGGDGSVALTVNEMMFQKNGEVLHLTNRVETPIKPVDMSLDQFYLSQYYAQSMDEMLEKSCDESLWIAKLDLIRQDDQIILDQVGPAPFDQYCFTPQQLMLLRRLESFYPEQGKQVVAAAPQNNEVNKARDNEFGLRNTATGVFELGIGLDHNQKKELFSTEIMHMLGKGPVYVQLGVEYISTGSDGAEDREILLGDTEIFDHDPDRIKDDRLYNVSTAVKIHPERGTFEIGVRLGQTTGLIGLRIRWYAFRLNEIDKKLCPDQKGKGYILINPDTVVVQPKGTVHLSPVFINMPTEACNYSLVDSEGGSVDQNGVYTAPAKEGVYEIRIEAISDPTIFTHAFAIVSQKKKEEKEAQEK